MVSLKKTSLKVMLYKLYKFFNDADFFSYWLYSRTNAEK